MGETVQTSISIPKILLNQVEMLAQQLNISRSQLFEFAVADFVSKHQSPPDANAGGERVINQGDIYWVQLDDPSGSEAGIPHPHIIIQDDVLNHSRIYTVVVCALTSNIKRANLPGSVLLEAGEGNLPRQSVVEVSKVSTVDKSQLDEYIGSLSEQRVKQILEGLRFLERSFFHK